VEIERRIGGSLVSINWFQFLRSEPKIIPIALVFSAVLRFIV
jgi:hypothetical protein